MEDAPRLDKDTLVADLAGRSLWRDASAVADAAVGLMTVFREIAPVGRRLRSLARVWSPAYEETLLLLRHLAASLGEMRAEARLILQAVGEPPADVALPAFASDTLLADMIRQLDALEPVASLPEDARSLLPLHVAELVRAGDEFSQLEVWLVAHPERAKYVPSFLCKLGATVELK